MRIRIEIEGEFNENQAAALVSALANGGVPATVQTRDAVVRPAAKPGASVTNSGTKESVAPARQPAKPSRASKAAEKVEAPVSGPAEQPVDSDIGAGAVNVETTGGKGPFTLEGLKALVVSRCAPDAENALNVKQCKRILAELTGVDINKIDDVPVSHLEECYAAIEQAQPE